MTQPINSKKRPCFTFNQKWLRFEIGLSKVPVFSNMGVALDGLFNYKKNISNKSQTATEYLIILAVVIVIALIVVGVLGGIPSIGGGAGSNAVKAQLASLDVGILNYKQDSHSTLLEFRNNNPTSIQINSMSINGKKCTLYPYNTILQEGQSKKITCYGVVGLDEGTRFEYDFNITYTDIKTQAQYVITPDVELIGTIVDGSELHTGQQECYDTDGDDDCDALESSLPLQDAHHDGTAKSFQDNGDGTVIDLHTGLMWNKSVGTGLTWQQALEHCNSSATGGYTDWRSPNVIEALSMIDFGRSDYQNPALNWSGIDYWTSTSQPDDLNDAMYVHTSFDGVESQQKTETDAVRCVRGSAQAIGLQTGQRVCYAVDGSERTCTGVGEDADVDSSAKGFVDVGDGTVIDEVSGLVWMKTVEFLIINWTDALNYCANIALCDNASIDGDENIVGTCSGDSVIYDDWRLPTVLEGITMIDYNCKSGSDPGCFSDYRSDVFTWFITSYWTGTTDPLVTGSAYSVGLSSGSIGSTTKVGGGAVRCVRGQS